jgi:hypothetical protein
MKYLLVCTLLVLVSCGQKDSSTAENSLSPDQPKAAVIPAAQSFNFLTASRPITDQISQEASLSSGTIPPAVLSEMSDMTSAYTAARFSDGQTIINCVAAGNSLASCQAAADAQINNL